MIIVREDLAVEEMSDLRGLDVAINSWDSHSGFNILGAMVAQLEEAVEPGERFFSRTLVTDGHARSILAVQKGEAQCASIDAVTLAMVDRYRPDDLEGLRVLCQSPMAPGLPFITSGTVSEDQLKKLQTGLFAALSDIDLIPLSEALMIKGAALAGPDDYQRILDLEALGAGIEL